MSAGDWLPLAQRILTCEWADRRGVNGWCETHDDPWPCDRAQEAAEVLAEELDQPTKEQKMSSDHLTRAREWLGCDQKHGLSSPPCAKSEDLAALLAEVAASQSDGYHTFAELYEYRMLYNAHAARGWLAAGIPVVKSWNHSDGEQCFGGGWFVVVAELPTGQVSNHYEAEHWGLFDVPEVALPPEYDGHTPADAADRLRRATGADQ